MSTERTTPTKVLVTHFPTFGKTVAQIQDKVLEMGERPAQGQGDIQHVEVEVGLQLAALVARALMNVGDEAAFTLSEVEHGQDGDLGLAWDFHRRVTGSTPGVHGDLSTKVFASAGQVFFEITYDEPVHSDEDYTCRYNIAATAMESPQAAREAAEQRWEFEQIREFSAYLRFSVISQAHAEAFRKSARRLSDDTTTAGVITRPQTREALAALLA